MTKEFEKIKKELKKNLTFGLSDLPEINQPYTIILKWNTVIENIRNEQNKQSHMKDADVCDHKPTMRLHNLIKNNHNSILKELKTLWEKGYFGLSMSEIDETQKELTNNETLWRPIWIKFLDSWAGPSKHFPTLKRIVQSVKDEVLLLHISVMMPGAKLKPHKGISMGVWRYHYGLDIPEGDVCIKVEDTIHKWENGKGFIFDDTVTHEVWNNTDRPRFIIFADVMRDMPNVMISKMNKFVHRLINDLPHTKGIKEKLEKEGINLS
jgi:hypothetical protein